MPIDITNLDSQVDESIKKIDSYVKDPTKTGSLDAELNDLLQRLNTASNEINDSKMLADHQARIAKLNQKIAKYEQKRNAITSQTRESLARSSESPDGLILINLKKELEKEISSPLTVAELTKLLDKLSSLSSDERKLALSYLWSKLSANGYNMTIQNGKVVLTHTTDSKNAEVLGTTLRSYVDARKINLNELQRAVLVGSGSF